MTWEERVITGRRVASHGLYSHPWLGEPARLGRTSDALEADRPQRDLHGARGVVGAVLRLQSDVLDHCRLLRPGPGPLARDRPQGRAQRPEQSRRTAPPAQPG